MCKFVILVMLLISTIAKCEEEKLELKGVKKELMSIKGIHNLNKIRYNLVADDVCLAKFIRSWYKGVYLKEINHSLILIIDDRSSKAKFTMNLKMKTLVDLIEHTNTIYKVTCIYSKGVVKYIIEDRPNTSKKEKQK